jgi:N-acetylneuraminate synthase/N,N'-diacetyllegionaminate synthase
MDFNIDNIEIGNGRVYIIAEAGSNHDGDFEQAKRLIDIAADAGADAVKFQAFKADTFILKELGGGFDAVSPGENAERIKAVDRVSLPREWLPELAAYARKNNLHFLCTPFDFEAVDLLLDIGVPAVKIASCDLTHHPLLAYVAEKGVPIILSTGMSTLEEIGEALGVIKEYGNPPVALLHCVAEYPTPPENVNLRAIELIRDEFGVMVGFSDHTLGISAPIAAAALGAVIIEKHFTIDRTLEGPDHLYALEPDELKAMVAAIREVEQAMGEMKKEPVGYEPEERALSRRCIVATVDIEKGKIITAEMLDYRMPLAGIPAQRWREVVGKRAAADIPAETPLQEGMLEGG